MKKALRICGIVAIVGVIIAAIVTSMSAKPSNAERVWDVAMTKGNLDAKNYFIVYSDIVCPYCVAFENAIVEHEEEFEQYLADNDILFEVRLSDFLYEYGETNPINSRYSALGAYCAKEKGKFWDYYSLAISDVWQDYFKTSGDLFNPELAASFRKNCLQECGNDEGMVQYRKFRGQDPDYEPYLKARGLK